MSNYANLKSAIQEVIKTNGRNEITGQLLQAELLAMINTLGYGYQFMGIANPDTVPGTPDAKVFYIAYTPGTYTNFNGITVTGLCVLKYATGWVKEDIPVSGGGGNFAVETTDLTLVSGNPNKLKFADRLRESNITTGKNYIILRESGTLPGQMSVQNAIYEIRYDFDLDGGTLTIPSGSTLFFNGGSLSNGTIALNGCDIIGNDWVGSSVTFTGNTRSGVSSVSWFKGATDSARLAAALSFVSIWKTISCGNLSITQSIALTSAITRSITLVDGVFDLSADLFTTSLSYVSIPNFTRCIFNGNGNKIFGSAYGVYGTFNMCSFKECSIQSSADSGTLCQSATLINCGVKNDSVNLIKCWKLYDCHIINMKCEAQNASVIVTRHSTESFGGTRNLWVSDSLFEGFRENPVFDLAGGCIKFENCYFEDNALGCINVTKSGSQNNVNFVMNGCSVVTTAHDAVTITGYTEATTVNISFYGNQFNTGGYGYHLVSGLGDAYNGLMAMIGNKKGQTSDVFCAEQVVPYQANTIRQETTNTTNFTHYYGGYLQFGKLVFFDIVFVAKMDSTTNLQAATGMPAPMSYNLYGDCINTSNANVFGVGFSISTSGTLTIRPGSENIVNGTAYRVKGWYLTNAKRSY